MTVRRRGAAGAVPGVVEYVRGPGAHKVELEVWPVRRDHYRRRDGSLRSALLMARLLDRAEVPAQ